MSKRITGYNLINLKDMINRLGEDRVTTVLLCFSCPLNKDVEQFLHHKAIEFAKQGLAVTHLLFASYKNNPTLIGYFAIATKIMFVSKKYLSKNKLNRITKFGVYDNALKRYLISAPLIGQLSKNYADGLDKMITGDELLKIACDTVSEGLSIMGGRIVYLESEDSDKLLEFYSRNGFVNFGKRELDQDEIELFPAKYLIQMFKYLD